jgi:branched-chain amino acid transport system substrate-binding protein
MDSFIKRAKAEGQTDPIQLVYDSQTHDFDLLSDQIVKKDPGGILLFGNATDSKQIILQIRQRKSGLPIFGTFSLLDEDKIPVEDNKYYEDVIIAASYPVQSSTNNLKFRNEYQKVYGKLPGQVATYSFDGMMILIKAIKIAGLDREEIQKSLIKIHYEGVSGSIQFDDKGKRIGSPVIMKMKNGVLVIPGEN